MTTEAVLRGEKRWHVECADAVAFLKTLPDGCVQCCVTSPPYFGLRSYLPAGHEDKAMEVGLEETPAQYVARLVEVFGEVRRVLRDDGTFWMNVADSYNAYNGNRGASSGLNGSADGHRNEYESGSGLTCGGAKAKDLLGVPWMLAFALRDSGWYLRSEITLMKVSPMPESVQDRPTTATEKLFLFTKNARYFYDQEAARVALTREWGEENGRGIYAGKNCRDQKQNNSPVACNPSGRNLWNWWSDYWEWRPEGSNLNHYAAFPLWLPTRCIKLGTSERGCCPKCWAPWRRILSKKKVKRSRPNDLTKRTGESGTGNHCANTVAGVTVQTTGWEPGCACGGVDLTPVLSPTGERGGDDPTMETGRKGMNRPRGDEEGRRPITRYEQEQYARQLRDSAARALMAEESGEAFAHYIRTDRSGARPVPHELLESWIGRGFLCRVEIPEQKSMAPIPCLVLDPFMGSGTTAVAALALGRRVIGSDLNEEYVQMARRRILNSLGTEKDHTLPPTAGDVCPLFGEVL